MRPLSRPRARWQFRLRRPRSATVVTAIAAALTFAFVHAAATGADSARTRWGPTVAAHVATSDLEAGHVISNGDVREAEVPRSLMPADAVTLDPVGRTVRVWVGAGEVVADHRLSGTGATGLAAMLDADERGVAVPRSGVDLPLQVGDFVDALATLDPLSDRGDPTVVLVERVMVIAADDDTVTLAVGREQARTLAHALATSTLTLVLVG